MMCWSKNVRHTHQRRAADINFNTIIIMSPVLHADKTVYHIAAAMQVILFLPLKIPILNENIVFQEVHRKVPYHSSKQICTQRELWTYTTTVPAYPVINTWIGVRTGLEGPCDNLVVEELTEEDLELCEVVCQPANVTECAKVMNGTDEEGNEIWEDDPEACVELEKTECKVQEKQTENEEQGADNAETDDKGNDEITEKVTKFGDPTPSTTEEEKHDDSAMIFFPDD